jgi:hypothetical protein
MGFFSPGPSCEPALKAREKAKTIKAAFPAALKAEGSHRDKSFRRPFES